MKKWFFHHFLCMITITNTMTNNESRDFVSIFSGKGLISSTIMINCSEFAKLTMRFHHLAAAQMGPLACTLPYRDTKMKWWTDETMKRSHLCWSVVILGWITGQYNQVTVYRTPAKKGLVDKIGALDYKHPANVPKDRWTGRVSRLIRIWLREYLLPLNEEYNATPPRSVRKTREFRQESIEKVCGESQTASLWLV